MPAKQFQLYQCTDKQQCAMIVEVVQPESCEICTGFACCEKPMELLQEKTADFKTEKHVPVVEKIDGGVKVKVGGVPHPMEPDHWIQFIEVQGDGKLYRQYLKPGDKPEADFPIQAENIVAREHCNKHGLWRA